MNYRWLWVLGLAFVSNAAQAYYGPFSTEAWLKFDAYVDARSASLFKDVAALNRDGSPERAAALDVAEKQISHLIGVFQSQSLKRELGYLGTLDEDSEQITFTALEPGAEEGRVRLRYSFEGKTVFDKSVFSATRTSVEVPFLKLPREPDRIYQISFSADGKNHCTDDYWNDEYDFYYFFDPDKPRCALKGNDVDVVRVGGTLTEIPNTRLTYPEYDRLYANGTLEIALFYGYIDPVQPDRVSFPVNVNDDGYKGMRHFETKLASMGFTQDASRSRDRFRLTEDGDVTEGIDFFHDWKNADGSVEIHVLLADTDTDSKDGTFHRYFKEALEKADVVQYDGHVGTPENLDLRQKGLQDARFDPDKYQIFFFNGCSTYPYFKKMYSDAKGSGPNLNLVTSGLEENASTSAANDMGFLAGFLKRKTLSFQTILRRLEQSSGRSGPYLYGVSGDERNTWQP